MVIMNYFLKFCIILTKQYLKALSLSLKLKPLCTLQVRAGGEQGRCLEAANAAAAATENLNIRALRGRAEVSLDVA